MSGWKCLLSPHCMSVSSSVSSSLGPESTLSVSIFIPDVGRGSRLGECGTQINLDLQNNGEDFAS